MAMTCWNEFDHDNEPLPYEQWQCPCPECNGWTPGPPEDEEDEGAWQEPSAEAMTPSEWVWAE